MKLTKIRISDLKPLKQNVRVHSEKQIDELVRSVTQFGQTRAIVVDEDNNILIGNGLYYALVKIGLEEAECFVKTGLTETQKKKLVLTDNRVYSLGSDDYSSIEKFVNDITSAGDFDIAGFDSYTLEMMTMSYDDNEDDMKDYGVVTDDKYTKPQPAEVNQPTPVTPTTSGTEEVAEEDIQVAEQRKSVVCPSCGEVIYID